LAALPAGVDPDLDRHARPQPRGERLVRIDRDPHRDALAQYALDWWQVLRPFVQGYQQTGMCRFAALP